MPGRPARTRALCAAAVLTTLAGVAGCFSGLPEASVSATRSLSAAVTSATSPSATTQLADLVERYGREIAAGRGATAATVAADSGDLSRRLTVATSAMTATGVESFTLALDPATLVVTGDRATMTAVGTYHLEGAAPGTSPFTLALTAREGADGWRITGDRGAASMSLPWDLAGVRRVENAQVIVLGNAEPAALDWYAEAAAAAWRDVRQVWPRRPGGKPVVIVPRTAREFAVQAGREAASDIAAVTVGSLEKGQVARGDVVIVNPAVQQRLTENGRRTILRHELTHVAIRGTTTGFVPQWLTEGFATQASWAGTGVPAQLAARARSWTADELAPTDTPSDADVESAVGATHSYDTAALLVDDLVTRHGRAAVVRFYEAMAAGTSRDAASQQAFGEPFAQVLKHWRTALARTAR